MHDTCEDEVLEKAVEWRARSDAACVQALLEGEDAQSTGDSYYQTALKIIIEILADDPVFAETLKDHYQQFGQHHNPGDYHSPIIRTVGAMILKSVELGVKVVKGDEDANLTDAILRTAYRFEKDAPGLATMQRQRELWVHRAASTENGGENTPDSSHSASR